MSCFPLNLWRESLNLNDAPILWFIRTKMVFQRNSTRSISIYYPFPFRKENKYLTCALGRQGAIPEFSMY